MRKISVKGIHFLLLIIALSFASCDSRGAGGGLAPDFSLQDTAGKTISLKDLRGRYVILDFWATWCPPCRESIPELVKIQRKYREKGLAVLAINVDDPEKVDRRTLAMFKDEHRIEYTVLRGSEKVVRDYSGTGGMPLPSMFLLNREGRVVERLVGFVPGRLEKYVKQLVE